MPVTREHWLDPANYPAAWDTRAKMAGDLIQPGSRVVDVGSGARFALKAYLPPGCDYVPCDMAAWSADVLLIDLENGVFPTGTYDVVVMLGVLEYLTRPAVALKGLRSLGRQLVLSYCHPAATSNMQRRRELGWKTALGAEKLREWLCSMGYAIGEIRTSHKNEQVTQLIYDCRRRS